MINILIVDKEKSTSISLHDFLSKNEERKVFLAQTAKESIKILNRQSIDVVLADWQLSDIDGILLLEKIKQIDPSISVIAMTNSISVDEAINAFRKGALDYIRKPFKMIDVAQAIEKALVYKKTSEENNSIDHFEKIICLNSTFKKIIRMIHQVAPSRANALITGEKGTGKNTVAKLLHKLSGRRDKPFLKINCSSLPDHILEEMLFGSKDLNVEGACKIEKANAGIIFFDNIDEMSPYIQAKLLDLLETKELDKNGSITKIDIRVFGSSSSDIFELVKAKKFNENLFYRLSTIELSLPPLRERIEDIIPLTKHFIQKHAILNSKIINYASPKVFSLLSQNSWKGNIRELERVVEKAVVLCETSRIEKHLLPDYILKLKHDPSSTLQVYVGTSLKKIEMNVIKKTLEFTKSNKVETAKLLGISLATLYRKIAAIKHLPSLRL